MPRHNLADGRLEKGLPEGRPRHRCGVQHHRDTSWINDLVLAAGRVDVAQLVARELSKAALATRRPSPSSRSRPRSGPNCHRVQDAYKDRFRDRPRASEAPMTGCCGRWPRGRSPNRSNVVCAVCHTVRT
jgi:hypothetical protein